MSQTAPVPNGQGELPYNTPAKAAARARYVARKAAEAAAVAAGLPPVSATELARRATAWTKQNARRSERRATDEAFRMKLNLAQNARQAEKTAAKAAAAAAAAAVGVVPPALTGEELAAQLLRRAKINATQNARWANRTPEEVERTRVKQAASWRQRSIEAEAVAAAAEAAAPEGHAVSRYNTPTKVAARARYIASVEANKAAELAAVAAGLPPVSAGELAHRAAAQVKQNAQRKERLATDEAFRTKRNLAQNAWYAERKAAAGIVSPVLTADELTARDLRRAQVNKLRKAISRERRRDAAAARGPKVPRPPKPIQPPKTVEQLEAGRLERNAKQRHKFATNAAYRAAQLAKNYCGAKAKAWFHEYQRRPEVKERARLRYAADDNGIRTKHLAACSRRHHARKENPIKIAIHRAKMAAYWRKRASHDVMYNLRKRCNRMIHHGLYTFGMKKQNTTMHIIGCSPAQLRTHLESQFVEGMTWANMRRDNAEGRAIHIDHIRPLASFDLSDEAQMLEAYNWRNLQPLWSWENQSKGAKLDWVRPSQRALHRDSAADVFIGAA